MNMNAAIETRVELEPGHLYVSAHEDFTACGSDVAALDRAIAEAKAYIAAVRKIKRHVLKHGVGEAPPPYSGPPISGQMIADAWAKVLSERPEQSIFESRAFFKGLR